MPEVPSIAVLRRWIALRFRTLRQLAGYATQAEAAAKLGVPPNRLNHIESGRNLPSDRLAGQAMALYDAEDQLPDLLASLALARSKTRTRSTAEDPTQFDLYIGLEQGARTIDTFDGFTIHGLLQHKDYARAVLWGNPSPVELSSRVRVRMERQAILRSSDPTHIWSVLPSNVLHTPVGDEDVMRAQMGHLLDLTELPNVTLQILPRSASLLASMHTPYAILRFGMEDDPGVVYVETWRNCVFYEDPAALADYTTLTDRLRNSAASPADSRSLIEAVWKGRS